MYSLIVHPFFYRIWQMQKNVISSWYVTSKPILSQLSQIILNETESNAIPKLLLQSVLLPFLRIDTTPYSK
jgi:hypothetical protein